MFQEDSRLSILKIHSFRNEKFLEIRLSLSSQIEYFSSVTRTQIHARLPLNIEQHIKWLTFSRRRFQLEKIKINATREKLLLTWDKNCNLIGWYCGDSECMEEHILWHFSLLTFLVEQLKIFFWLNTKKLSLQNGKWPINYQRCGWGCHHRHFNKL